MTIWHTPFWLQCTIEIANGFDAILIENVPQNAQNGPKNPFLTHNFVSGVQVSHPTIHLTLPSWSPILSQLRCKCNWNQPFTITFNYGQMGHFDTIFNKIKTISHTNLLTKPNSHFRFQFDSATESDHLMRAIAGAMQNRNRQLLQCHFYWKHAPEWRKLAKNVLSDTHFRFCSPGFKLSNSFHVAKSITYTAPITVQIAV